MKVLIVDDEELMRELLVQIFEDEDHEVASASNGSEAIESYIDFQPDALVLDVMMPGMNGFEVCEKIRNQYDDKKTKIYLLTGMGGDNVEAKGLKLGADQVLFKPMSTAKLLETVTKQGEES